MKTEEEKSVMLGERLYDVVKHNDLIQKSRFNLSTTEQKIILYMISKIQFGDKEFDIVVFKIKDFCEICGIDEKNGKNYALLKSTIGNLAAKYIWIKMNDDTETIIRWIDRPFIHPKSGTIELKLDELMKPYLLHLKSNFTKYCYYYILPMKSKYSIRLYELLKSYQNMKKCSFEIEQLKKILFAETYKRFPDFKRKVIDTALSEINEFSDINMEYKLEKNKNKVVKITFTITQKRGLDERIEAWRKIESKLNKTEVYNHG